MFILFFTPKTLEMNRTNVTYFMTAFTIMSLGITMGFALGGCIVYLLEMIYPYITISSSDHKQAFALYSTISAYGLYFLYKELDKHLIRITENVFDNPFRYGFIVQSHHMLSIFIRLLNIIVIITLILHFTLQEISS